MTKHEEHKLISKLIGTIEELISAFRALYVGNNQYAIQVLEGAIKAQNEAINALLLAKQEQANREEKERELEKKKK